MPEWISDLSLDWGPLGFWHLVARLALATLLGGLVGLERERLDRAAGLRTHALVSVASALLMIVSTFGFPSTVNGVQVSVDPSRLAAQVVSGIGFLGAGVIIFRENTIRGLTTAATVWSVAGIGLAAGGGLYLVATVGTIFMLFIQAGLKPVERKFFARNSLQHRVVIEAAHRADLLAELQAALREMPIQLRSFQFEQSPSRGRDVIELTLAAEHQRHILDLVGHLRAMPAVHRITYQRSPSRMETIKRMNEMDDEDQ